MFVTCALLGHWSLVSNKVAGGLDILVYSAGPVPDTALANGWSVEPKVPRWEPSMG